MSLVGYITAYLLDIVIGDPKWFPHPVRYIGRGISLLEKISLKFASAPIRKRGAGIITVVIVISSTYLIAFFLIKAFYSINSLLGEIASILIAYTTISVNDLAKEARGIFSALKDDNLIDARKRLSRIVGRDTKDLDEKGVIRGAVESVAENTSDGIIAPLFYLAIGGPALALAYKAVNTLDSMIGYKNERYRDFGWAAARLDDIANYIPARITGVLIAIASAIIFRVLFTIHYSLKTMFRDGRNHSSPNSGIPEAAIAGALGVQLGGPSYYFGELKIKPTIGEPKRQLMPEDIKSSVRIMYAVSLFAVLLVLFLRYWIEQ
ncbi:MAG: cobalamin biosynthesis protein CobD [Nitrospirae bacterium]|nr:cobalamin biosynthesis protein CobD [Nitrospirota bacterium]